MSLKPIELNTVLFALRRLQQHPVGVGGMHGPMLNADEIEHLCEMLNFGVERSDEWAESTLNDEERESIESTAGVVEHETGAVIIDPDDNRRWLLCWVRLDRVPKMDVQLKLPLPDTRRARPASNPEREALETMVQDLENAGEILGSDENRIALMREALEQPAEETPDETE